MPHMIGWLFGGSGAVLISALGAWLHYRYKTIRQRFSIRSDPRHNAGAPSYLDPHFVDELEGAPYRVEPATMDDLRWIATKTAQLHQSHAVSYEKKLAWFKRNPSGFWVILNRYGTLVGSCELIPVEYEVIEDLAAGKTREQDKSPEQVIGYADRSKAQFVYLENVMAILPTNEPNPWALCAILKAAPRIVAAMGLNSHGIRIYTMSANHFYTEFGVRKSTQERLLRRLGFEIASNKTAQGLPLYSADLESVVTTSRELVKNIESRRTSGTR
jgi:hypothetical protein